MKKIIAIVVITLALGFSANAQQKDALTQKRELAAQNEESAKVAALKDIDMLAEVIELSNEQKEMFKPLFTHKHKTLLDHPNFSDERRSVLAENIERKLKSGLNPDQVAKLDQNPTLLKKLTH